MSASCGHDVQFDGTSRGYRRALYAVIGLNAGMFAVEITAGALSGSQALRADALDFLADALTYGLSLWVIGRPLVLRARIAMAKGLSLLMMGLWVFGSTVWLLFGPGMPRAEVMGAVGALALMANLASVLLLMRYRDGDANVRSVWLCSRNDAVGNVAVMGAALAVGLTATPWPDLLVATIMSGLFLSSAWQILTRARREMRQAAGCGDPGRHGHDHDHGHDHAH
jgi:Co/Zn/Cd efflux system component